MAFPSGYNSLDIITIDPSHFSADEEDFILHVDLSTLSSQFWETVRSDGGDIRATLADGVTQIPTELVWIDAVAETGELYVRVVGTTSSTVDTVINIFYNGTDTALASDDTYGSEAVWGTDYVVVVHFHGETVENSVGNGLTVTKIGTPGTTDGEVGDGGTSGGGTGYYSISGLQDNALFDPNDGLSEATFSMYLKMDAQGGGSTNHPVGWGIGSDGRNYWAFSSDAYLKLFRSGYAQANVSAYDLTTWHRLTVTTHASEWRGYYNDSMFKALVSPAWQTTSENSLFDTMYILRGTTDTYKFYGIGDELRVKQYEDSPARIAAEIANTASPSTFYSVEAASSGNEYTVELAETISMNASMYRNISKSISETLTMTANLMKGIALSFKETIGMTASLSRFISILFTESVSLSARVSKGIAKIITESMQLTAIMRRGYLITLTATIRLSANYRRMVARTLVDTVKMTASPTINVVAGIRRVGKVVLMTAKNNVVHLVSKIKESAQLKNKDK